MNIKGDMRTRAALRLLFSRILEPLALYRVNYDEGGNFAGMVYMNVNSAYEKVMGIRRKAIIGRSFYEIWSEKEREWHDIILQVAQKGIYARHEGWSVDTGKYLHALAFSPLKDVVAVIFLDMTEWKNAESALVEKEKLLVEYRQELRHLTAEISIAEERSRRKFSTKLHDNIGYSIIDLMNSLRNLSCYVEDRGDGFLKKWAESSFADVEKLLHATRSLTLEIGSPMLYEVGLEAALESLIDRMLTHRDIAFDFRQSGPKLEIDVNNRILIYQMTQELLLNVIKHSNANHVILDVHRSKKNIRVLVEDNGCGFLADKKQHWGKLPGIGLFSIRERLHYMGGKLRILSEKGKGCSVFLIASVSEGENEK